MDESLTFEDHIALIERRLDREPRYRLALYRLLDFCAQPRSLEEIDQEVSAYPEMAVSPFTTRTLLRWLVEPEAIVAVDEEGNPVVSEEPEDEGEDDGSKAPEAIVEFYCNSVVGAQVLDNFRQSDPIGALFRELPQYEGAFIRVLKACQEPKSRKEVEELFKDDPILTKPKRVYPNMFLDKLERVGALVFQNNWVTTQEGIAFLADR